MQRRPEPELMELPGQARAYALADFADAHQGFVEQFARRFGRLPPGARVADLGCGPCDVTVRFAHAFPGCTIDGFDAGASMLAFGRARVCLHGLAGRVRLHQARLPLAGPARYDAVLSNSVLHHLAEPAALWRSIAALARPGARVLVMDLMRPDDEATLEALAARHAGDAPAVLAADFRHSLAAAYRPQEVRAQIAAAGLPLTVTVVSDRHWVAAGRLAPDWCDAAAGMP